VDPSLLENTARNWRPRSPAATVKLYDELVAPAIAAQVVPSGDDCHCAVGVGVPVAADANVTLAPGTEVMEAGETTMTGADAADAAIGVVTTTAKTTNPMTRTRGNHRPPNHTGDFIAGPLPSTCEETVVLRLRRRRGTRRG
jgi:hypothetical protein